MSGLNLGFRIEDDESVRFDDGSWRFATAEEAAMWERIQNCEEYAAEAWAWLDKALEALGVTDVFQIAEAHESLAAFRAAKDGWETG